MPTPPILESFARAAAQMGTRLVQTAVEGGAEALLEEAQEAVQGVQGRIATALQKVGARRQSRSAGEDIQVEVIEEPAEDAARAARRRQRRRRD